MIKINEKELKSILNKFSNTPIKIIFHGALIGIIEFQESKYKFTRRKNTLFIEDNKSNNKLCINTKPLYKTEINEEKSIVSLYLDYNLRITIEHI